MNFNVVDGTDEIFEEDHLLLDEVLDYIEKNEIEKQQRIQEDDYNATVDIYRELEMGVKFKKQEKLLELYKELMTVKDDMINKLLFVDSDYYAMDKKEKYLEIQIREVENENNR